MILKSLASLSFLLGLCMTSFCQTPEQNLMKYWRHRNQLDEFILKGEGIDPKMVHGSYLPAEHRREAGKPGIWTLGGDYDHFLIKWPDLRHTSQNPTCGGLNIGADATMYLGWYIGVLAIEYRLRMNHGTGIDPQIILGELWNALAAFERLDRMAETLLGYPENFNGYFLRDDVMPNLPNEDANGVEF